MAFFKFCYAKGKENSDGSKKVSFAEAEEADDIYWANASYAERLNTIYNLRKMYGGNGKIKKVVKKRSIYEEEYLADLHKLIKRKK